MRFNRFFAILICPLCLVGCFDDDTPIRLGVISSLSGPHADLGQTGRNGLILAVEEINRAGGIDGRPIELVIRDDATKPDMGVVAARELIDEKVEAIIGPTSSSICKAILEVTEPVGMLLFSPTVMSDAFTGQDDNFLRLGSISRDNAQNDAEFMVKRRGIRRLAVVVDETNPTFTKPFVEAFKSEFSALGGETVAEFWDDFRDFVGFEGLVRQLREMQPDAVYLVTNAVDTARISQQIRKSDAGMKIVASKWAATPQLIELGGKAVEGIELPNAINSSSTAEKYIRFVNDYRRRFETAPNSVSVQSYEVIMVLQKALQNRKDGESLKQAILANHPYQGLQEPLFMDDYGDTHRKSFFVVVKDANFVPAP